MKLNGLTRRALVYSDLRADLSYSDIAKALGCREHSVRRALSQVLSDRYFSRRASFNLFRIGLVEFNIYLTFNSETLASREKILSSLEKAPGVKWIQELASGHHTLIGFLAPSARDVSIFLDSLGDTHGNFVFAKSVSTVASYHFFGRRYLDSNARKPKCIDAVDEGVADTLDVIDRRLLREMTSENFQGVADLSRRLKMPASTVQFRINRLKKEGVLLGYTYNLIRLPQGIHAFRVHIYTRGNSANILARLKKMAFSDPSIVYIVKCLATWDYEVVVETYEQTVILEFGLKLEEALGALLLKCDVLSVARIRTGPHYPFPD